MLKLIKNNLTNVQLPRQDNWGKWLKRTLEVLGQKDLEGEVELYFVDSEKIRALNQDFRGQDKPTDVLSFSFLEGERFPGDNLVGQVFIEPLIAQKQAEDHGVEWRDELEFLWVHALLHIFGYDHEKKEDFREMYGLHSRIMPDPKWETFVEQIYREHFV